MSEYEKIIKKVKKNPEYSDFVNYEERDYSKFTNYTEKDYLPYPSKGFSTVAIHAGTGDQVHGSVNVPIDLSTTFKQISPGQHKTQYYYGRCGNPTRHAFEQGVAELEYGKYSMALSSGVAAITAILHLFKPGDHIICCDDVYSGTQRYLRTYSSSQYQIEVEYVDCSDLNVVKKHIKENTRLLWLETPSNPTLKIIDIQEVSKLAHDYNKDIIVATDNTFLSPYLQSPLLLGADIVMHSVSKYIGGHSDIIMGAIVTNNKDLYDKVYHAGKAFGGVPSPHDCYYALRGLKSLSTRVKQHCYNAYCLAHYLEQHPTVKKVFYSGLQSHPQKELIKKQQRGYGGMVSFQINGGLEEGKKFLNSLKVFTLAESLGGVESLAELPAIMTHGYVPKDHREAMGITDGFIRLSVGIEDINDIIYDVEQALEKCVQK